MPYVVVLTAQELIRRLRKLARKKGLDFIIDAARGKGDHAKVFLGGRSSFLPGQRGELKPKTLRSICYQLGVKPEDL